MDLLQLKYFCAIVEEGHMTRAAARLSIAQPALSASLGRLEKELGVSLFDRVGRNICLNECGQSLCSRRVQQSIESFRTGRSVYCCRGNI